MKKWQKLDSKSVFAHKRLNVYEDKVRLPNGHETDYIHFGKGQDGCCVIAVNHDGLILVQKEYSYPPDEWLYQFPGGGVNDDETPEQGALRELMEEAGYTGKLECIGWFYPNNRRSNDKMHVFIASDLVEDKAPRDIEEKFISYWKSEDEISSMIQDGEVVNYSMLAAWALFTANKI